MGIVEVIEKIAQKVADIYAAHNAEVTRLDKLTRRVEALERQGEGKGRPVLH